MSISVISTSVIIWVRYREEPLSNPGVVYLQGIGNLTGEAKISDACEFLFGCCAFAGHSYRRHPASKASLSYVSGAQERYLAIRGIARCWIFFVLGRS